MRKHQQRQILDLLQTIKRAQSLNLYAGCREGAVGIGAFIDSVEGKGTQAAKILAEYCGLLSESRNQPVDEQQLQKYLSMIENSIRHDLKPPDKIEVAFFPYNASMFDSMESIYLAAKNDPQCDAYVVPIPYYNLLPGGKFGQMHYEGNLYPDNIPITNWREYDVEARNPDIIFIHTPYDEDNLVTSIHPDFYSERLRNFTGLLVYVPYFVCADDVPEWLCVHSGTVYADKIIVQSEKVKQTYIRVFKDFGKKNNCEKYFSNLEDKIVALGSPKFDKTLNTKREDCPLPDKWRALIERPDGTRKKVIFYNTSLSGLLRGNEPYLKKIKSVLAFFRERGDVVLWWRPHPLSKNTYRAMRPHLLDEYEQIVTSYKDEYWGIYDDTPDLHRAIAVSDAYYGDRSSVTALYQVCGKPVIIQNININKKGSFVPDPLFSFFIDDSTYLWFTSERLNALFKLDKTTWQTDYVGSFSNEVSRLIMFRKPAINDGRIFFPPFNAREIGVYTVKDNTFQKIPYKNNKTAGGTKAFCAAIEYGEFVYFTPYMYPAIMRLNTLTDEIEYYSDWVEPLKELTGDVRDAYFLCPLLIENSIMLASCGANAVVEFNLITRHSIIHEVGKKGYCYSGICFDGENYWLSPRHNTPLVKWNPKTGETLEFNNLYCDDVSLKFAFLQCEYCGGYVWLLPRMAKHAIKIDVKTNDVTIAEEFEVDCQDKAGKPNRNYYFIQISGENIYAYHKKIKTLIVYNCRTKERKDIKVQLKPIITKAIIGNLRLNKNYFFHESSSGRLENIINAILHFDSNGETILNDSKKMPKPGENKAIASAGSEILKYAKTIILNGK